MEIVGIASDMVLTSQFNQFMNETLNTNPSSWDRENVINLYKTLDYKRNSLSLSQRMSLDTRFKNFLLYPVRTDIISQTVPQPQTTIFEPLYQDQVTNTIPQTPEGYTSIVKTLAIPESLFQTVKPFQGDPSQYYEIAGQYVSKNTVYWILGLIGGLFALTSLVPKGKKDT